LLDAVHKTIHICFGVREGIRETVASLPVPVGFREGLHAAPGSAIERNMITRPTANVFAHAEFSGASSRALSANLLLLGLIGDRRVR